MDHVPKFDDWVEQEASGTDHALVGSLAGKALEESEPQSLFEKFAFFAIFVILFVIYLAKLLSRGDIKRAVRELSGATSRNASTTDEVVRDVLKDAEYMPSASEANERAGEVDASEQDAPPEHELSGLAPISEALQLDQQAAANFLEQIKEQTKRRNETLTEDLRRLEQYYRIIFMTLMAAAILTMSLIVLGAVLLINDAVAIGILVEVAGLLPGAGTVILRRLLRENQRRKDRVETIEEDNRAVLQAVQATLLIPDAQERANAIGSLASKLADRATRSE